MDARSAISLGAAALLLVGCHPPAPQGSLVVTQTPAAAEPPQPPPVSVLDARYPPGSRVVLLIPPYRNDTLRVLSGGLVAAGDPCVSWDGRRVYFSGKEGPKSTWQIYMADMGGGRPRRVTHMAGGAMDPALGAHGQLIFSSPVPLAGRLWTTRRPAALYGQLPGRAPRRLTFGPDSAVDATVLHDGRILFVTAEARDNRLAAPHLSLFTINDDGSEVTAYACQDDGVGVIHRPRELSDGRIAFLAAHTAGLEPTKWAECVRSAAPFATRSRLFGFPGGTCRSVEPLSDGAVLACIDTSGRVGRAPGGHAAVFRIAAGSAREGAPLFDDPQRDSIEALSTATRARPIGHTSDMRPGDPTGILLCLDANDSSVPADDRNPAPAAELRVFAEAASGRPIILGRVPVASDGSAMAELPADVPLGFDTLDARGRILRHQPAFLWLRSGENRGCVGCHEPRNHAPRNILPLAALARAPRLDFPDPARAPRVAAP